jgi:hypothetical protein
MLTEVPCALCLDNSYLGRWLCAERAAGAGSKPIILVQGVVVDKDTHAPVEGAEVTVMFVANGGDAVTAATNVTSLPGASAFTASIALISQLRVVLANAAVIAVHLTEGGNPSKNRIPVVLLGDGMSFAEFRKQIIFASDPSGATTFGGLAPGTYRAVRSGPDQPQPTSEALFQAMLADASRLSAPVTVEEGQTATINWDLP